VILSYKLIMYALLLGGGYLLIIDLLWYRLEKAVPVFEGFPDQLIEHRNWALFVYCYAVELIFFVFIPAFVYFWFYSVMPVSGIRGGVAVGLFLFLLGFVPYAILMLFRIKIPVVFLLYQSMGLLIKIVGSLSIIGYLYSL